MSLSRLSFIQPVLYFPFELSDPRFRDMIELVAPALPFKLSAKCFRRQVRTKTKYGYKTVRIAPAEFAGVSDFVS